MLVHLWLCNNCYQYVSKSRALKGFEEAWIAHQPDCQPRQVGEAEKKMLPEPFNDAQRETWLSLFNKYASSDRREKEQKGLWKKLEKDYPKERWERQQYWKGEKFWEWRVCYRLLFPNTCDSPTPS
jgi:hypothetical protein